MRRKMENKEINVHVTGSSNPGCKVIILGKDGRQIHDTAEIEAKLDELGLLDFTPTEPIFAEPLTYRQIEPPPDYYLNDRHKKKGHERPYKFHR